ncbi:hypothetical protein SADUNF_Sadunf11G0089200 [Salix dunnii]|uniref:Arf-GAP domain-containing protein n=1 Tax=Salix dunnii TaxID=1413687 RepID=A0A835JKY2_9ROSI|nr:hypothetical protein SADUNF_Sadunf11G0089200 [Salix dunnii]
MNGKANVSKELNARHRKILEGLLKLPENRECADCKAKYYELLMLTSLQMQRSKMGKREFGYLYMHAVFRDPQKSWGTHIKAHKRTFVNKAFKASMKSGFVENNEEIAFVRSATLDTWLPEQVAFIQSMGNERVNSYWEAELPPNYDRVGIENFIRAKYEEKRWVSKDGTQSPPSGLDERSSLHQRPDERSGHGRTRSSENLFEEKKNSQVYSSRNSAPATRISVPVPPRGPKPVTPAKPQQVAEKAEPMVEVTEAAKKVADAAPAVSAPKVDFATDLFNLLSMDGPSENGSVAASNEDNGWAGLQSATVAEELSTPGKAVPTKAVENKTQSNSGIEDLFKDLPSLATPSVSEKPQKDVKNDIMSLFEKSNMVSPFAMHQQQLAMLAQQQQLLMAAAAKSAGGDPKVMNQQQLAILAQQQQLLAAAAKSVGGDLKLPGSIQQQGPNGINIPAQNWPNMGYQIPGLMMPVAGQGDLQKLMQTGNIGMTHPGGSAAQYPGSSLYDMGQVTPANGVKSSGASKTQPAAPVSSGGTKIQAGKDYDFSSLTQGMFSKHGVP